MPTDMEARYNIAHKNKGKAMTVIQRCGFWSPRAQRAQVRQNAGQACLPATHNIAHKNKDKA